MKQIRMTDSTKTLDARSETPLVSKLIRECAETLRRNSLPHFPQRAQHLSRSAYPGRIR